MNKVRLLVYRKDLPTDDESDLVEFVLDLKDSPDVKLNYNWLDIKEPDQRKSNFSQTIKVPFSDRNNEFFENWFDVNLDTAVYNPRYKYRAVVLVDSVPQLEGFIQLKTIYLNARQYEVVIFGDTANFFNDIKGSKLKDVFTTELDNGDIIVDTSLDHKLNLDNIVDSWEGGLTTLSGGTSNDVMYPIIDWGHTTLPLTDLMFNTPSDVLNIIEENGMTAGEGLRHYGMITPTILKPAMRLQKLLHMIATKAGYQIKSAFLGIDGNNLTDTQWFSRQFMTLAPQYPKVQTKLFNGFRVEEDGTNSNVFEPGWAGGTWDIAGSGHYTETCGNCYDGNNLFDDGTIYMIDGDVGDDSLAVISIDLHIYQEFNLPSNLITGAPITNFNIEFKVITFDGIYPTVQYSEEVAYPNGAGTTVVFDSTFTLESEAGSINYLQWVITTETGTQFVVSTNGNGYLETIGNQDSLYTNGVENAEVVMAQNMPDLLQSDFVKDIINRYNLIILSDTDDSKKVIIEPYQDYINSGSTKYWTNKLDTSKEQVIKTTNELQAKQYLFSDQEDTDYHNASYINSRGRVYGSINILSGNEFAKDRKEVFSVFSPFIAVGLRHWSYGVNGVMSNQDVAIHQNFGLDNDGSPVSINDGKSKLFYYSGTPIQVSGNGFNGAYDFHILSQFWGTGESWSAYDIPNNKFPLCTQFNLDAIGSGVTTSTKLLHWEWYNPYLEALYNTNYFGTTRTEHGLYYDYWSQFINEIFSDESRIMECYLNLTPQDIQEFSFANPIYLKNTLWRVLKVDNYLVGETKSTKVTLLKVIQKLNYDCEVVPSVFNINGTISFVDPSTGSPAQVTNECCEGLNSAWTFVQTNALTGAGDCFSNSTIYYGDGTNNDADDDSGSDVDGVMSGQVMNGVLGNDFNNINNNGNMLPMPGGMANYNGNYLGMYNLNTMSKDQVVLKMSVGILTTGQEKKSLNNLQDPLGKLIISRQKLYFIEIVVQGTIIYCPSDDTLVGLVGNFKQATSICNRYQSDYKTGLPVIDIIGTSTTLVSHKDTNFPATNINPNSVGGNFIWSPSVDTLGAGSLPSDCVIKWSAIADIKVTNIRQNKDNAYIVQAIWQNDNNITLQNGYNLIWD